MKLTPMELLVQIELLRQVMCDLGLMLGINHPDVLLISQKLDLLINEYYKMIT
jgi:hypothetical protein